jgi:carbonic anhydrase/acetyltransferase-like protein (isoleucine patch superfamily)
MNKPLIVHNIDAANKALKGKIREVGIPRNFKESLNIVSANYSDIVVEEIEDEQYQVNDNSAARQSDTLVRLPINCLVRSSSTSTDSDSITIDLMTYPWDFLAGVQNVLQDYVTTTYISPSAKVSKTCIIEGPCIIEDDVILDDFCKIKGPCYISRGSLVGMSSLVRNSMLGPNTRIGFNCEIAKTYFSGDTKISHQNVILDSLIGKNVWFGGYSATANVLLTRTNVKYQINGTLVDTGTDHFGAVVGDNCSVGAYVLILPGRYLAPNSMIQAGTIVGKSDNNAPFCR